MFLHPHPGLLTTFGGGPVTSVSIFTTAQQSTGGSMGWPSNIRTGDVAVLFEVSRNTAGNPHSDVDMTTTGWSSPIFNQSDGTVGTVERDKISYKIIDGSEGANFTGISGSLFNSKQLIIIRGDNPIIGVASSSINNEVTTGNPSSQNVAASGATPPVIVFGWYMSNNNIDPRIMSPSKDNEINNGIGSRDIWVAWRIYNSSPSNTSVDMDDEGTNYLRSFYMEFN